MPDSNTVVRDEVAEVLRLRAAELLAEPGVELGDNFLDLGGHSLMALDLSKEMERRFGAPIDIRLLFEESFAAVAEDIAAQAQTT